MVFRQVPAGRFTMGSPAGEPGREQQERAHDVTIPEPIWMGAFEVTHAQWRKVVGSDPSWFDGEETLPVENVTWLEAQMFLRRLAALSPGSRFRLPTETEWEYACRAGTRTAYHTGSTLAEADANYARSPETMTDGRPVPVGSYSPNAWGLYDMHGNVWEWTADEHCPYSDGHGAGPQASCGSPLKVIRGGSWYFGADSARCALRYTHPPVDRGFSLGFRVVREATG
jgi:formylglycine-generating enzyme required for sulfatase activity